MKPRGYEAIDLSVGLNLYKTAYGEKMTFSQLLEKDDPTENYPTGSALAQMDAYERQLFRAGIVTRSNPAKGIYASTGDAFFISTNGNEVLYPEFINRVARQALQAPDILGELVGQHTSIQGSAYKTFYVDLKAEDTQKKRTPQGADMPVATISEHDNTINIKKKGIVIEVTYEAARRMQIDMMARLIQGILQQAAVDLADMAINTLISGDGNPNTAATNYNLTSFGGTSGTIDWKSWLKYRAQFFPRVGDVSVVDLDQLINVMDIKMPTLDPLALLAVLNGGMPTGGSAQLAQNLFSTPMRYVYLPSSKLANKVLTINKENALEQVTEIGADIMETDRLIRTQFQEIVLSQVTGFGVIFPQVVKTLTTNA